MNLGLLNICRGRTTGSAWAALLLWAAADLTVLGGGLLREVYTDIPGNTIADLIGSPKFPDAPDTTNLVTEFECPTDELDNYGQRVRGFVIPPVDGTYRFWIASDDNSVLYLSTDQDPANKAEIASVPGWTASREWDRYPSQESGHIGLEANKPYYIEALMKEGGGGDNLAVRWEIPGGVIEEPIPEIRLLAFGTPFAPPTPVTQPADLSVTEGQPATFSVQVSNPDPLTYQWQRNRTDIPGATRASYTLPVTTLSHNTDRFRCRLANSLGTVTSGEAILTVLPDVTPPTLVRVQNFGLRTLSVLFSEPVETATAANAANYAITPATAVASATLDADARTVTLTTSNLAYGVTYTLTVNRVRDRATVPNTLAAQSQIAFQVVEYAPGEVGNPIPPSSSVPVIGGVDIAAAGTGLGDRADQFSFNYQKRTGDFDVRVRLESLELASVWTLAGLMARESLATNSPYAALLATPSISGISFWSRVSTNARTLSGSFPVNYPYTWLRLQRAGNRFTGFASYDGAHWAQVGTVTNLLSPTLYFGMAVSSQSAGHTARAQFRDLNDVVNAVVGDWPGDLEPLGPSSRRTGLALSEIMYHPADRLDGRDLEFIELFNSQATAEDASGFRLSGDIDYVFPPNTILPAGGFLVVARVPKDVEAVYGLRGVLGGYPGELPNAGGTVRLRNHLGAVLLEVNYSDDPPWPAAADGAGHSLVLARPSYGEGSPKAWAASQLRGGSPGRPEALRIGPLDGVRINELLAHTDDPVRDFVELYNPGDQTLDLTGACLTDDPTTPAFRLPAGTLLPPRGFLVLTEDQLGFGLNSSGEAVYLLSPDLTQVIDAVKFGPQANGISLGRYPDGAPGFQELRSRSPGSANPSPLVRDVVINEIMYHPISEAADDQFLELYNRSSNAVSIAYWRFMDGIDFTFPSNAVIAGGDYAVVARNAARLLTNHPGLSATRVFGDFQGQLSFGGERVALARPDDPTLPYQDFVVVDEVTYGDGGRWGRWSDGGGSSLELMDPHSDNRLAANWADSDETAKAPWTTLEVTGVLDLGNDSYGINNLQVMLMGAGECLLDDVQVIDPSGVNLVGNSTFEQDPRLWVMGGTHVKSGWESSAGFNSARSFHLRASARGGTEANQVKTDLLSPLTPGSHATLRARVRWLCGNPEILLRLRGNYLEDAGTMDLPRDLGTPGSRNSRAVANAGPAISDVSHRPVLPALGQPVRVSARVSDPDGVGGVRLFYRIDPSQELTSLGMTDDGIGGDDVAGDGLYTATLPGQPTTNLVAFHVKASDLASPRANGLFPGDAPVRECLVNWGETDQPGNFPTYHLWCTKATLDEWANRAPSSNEPLDGTFAYGRHRAIYNMAALYSGSPFHWTGYDSPLGGLCNYVLQFPPDEPFLGSSDFVLNLPANLGSDRSAQREQFAYWMARQMQRPYTYRRFLHFRLNGANRGFIFEDAQQPNREYVQQWFPDDPDGELFKIEDWFEYDDTASGFVNIDATLEDFVGADGAKKQARYRWIFRKRAVQDSAHDYSRLFELADAVNTPESDLYHQQVEALVDVDQWMRTMAFRHVVGDWDAYGYRRGKNMYAYKPAHGKWQLLDWDIAFAFGLGDGTTADLFDNRHFDGSVDVVTDRMYNHPPFRRAYLRALEDAVQDAMASTNVAAVIDEKHAALKANAVSVTSPASVKSWIAGRRTYIQKVLAANNAPFALLSNPDGATVSDRNLLTFDGTAPLGVKTLKINGIAYPVTWTSTTNWTLRVPLRNGANVLLLQGFDSNGRPDARVSSRMSVTFTGADDPPATRLVISEIMYHPAAPDTAFVEIHNASTFYTFDLSGYRLRGTDFTFPEGTLIEPGAYLVVVNNRSAFTAAYGNRVPIVGEFQGRLQNDGESLSLVKPGATPAQDLVADQVVYDDDLPWAAAADGQGASLQLIDPWADNRRVANWTAVTGDGGPASGWRLATATATASGSSLFFYLASSGDVYLDDISLVEGSTPEVGANLVKNPGFESALAGSWTVSADDPDTKIVTTFKHGGSSSVHVVSANGGISLLPSLAQTTTAVKPGTPYTLSFWYLPGGAGGGLAAGLTGSPLQLNVSLASGGVLPLPATPGTANSVQTNLAPFPTVWINELQPRNVTGRADHLGHRDPWIELINTGPTPVNLGDCFLTSNLTNLLEWAFPAATILPAGDYLLIWLDGEPAESTPTELHAGFRIDPSAGTVALIQQTGSQPRVLDYLTYDRVPADHSFGSFPEGDPYVRQVFDYPTAGAANNNAVAPIIVRINEWMADNRSTLPDPADNDFDDWFELYNPGESAVDLSGYTLTDDFARPGQWTLPAGTLLPGGGFLLIWADNETQQNALPHLGLHANFQLSKSGDSIGLFAPNGTLVHAVSFGPQRTDVSQGLFPDGAASGYFPLSVATPGRPNVFYRPQAEATNILPMPDGILIDWSVAPGRVYQLQFKDDLNDASWQVLGAEMTASTHSLSVFDPSLLAQGQRFYRLVLVR